MNGILRLFLAICSAAVLVFVVRKIRKSQFDAIGSLFWLILSAGLLIVAIFPKIAFFFSSLLGIESPANFVFLVLIALLLIREFTLQVEVALLKKKLSLLIQEISLRS